MLATIEKVLFLQEVSLLGAAPTEALAHLAAVATEEVFVPGSELWRPGDPADSVFFVVEGEVMVEDPGRRSLAPARRAADLGVTALVQPALVSRETRAIAILETIALRVRRDDFLEVLGDHPELVRALLVSLAGTLRAYPLH